MIVSKPPFKTFGQWLRYHRKLHRYSMRGLGGAVGVTGSYVSTLENSNDPPYEMSPRPSRRVIEKIASVLAVDAEEGKRLAGHSLKPGPVEGEASKGEGVPPLVPASGPAAQLVQEKLAVQNKDIHLSESQMNALIDKIESYVEYELYRQVKEDRQKQEAA